MCYEWKVRLELAQEESPTGQSCNLWTKPFGFRVGLKVDGYAVAVGNGFPKPSKSLDIAKDAGAADDDANRDVFPWKIRETAPGTENVLREDERKPVLNIERGLNSKISLRAVH